MSSPAAELTKACAMPLHTDTHRRIDTHRHTVSTAQARAREREEGEASAEQCGKSALWSRRYWTWDTGYDTSKHVRIPGSI
eukprot:54178-Rhodomonas_salina.4